MDQAGGAAHEEVNSFHHDDDDHPATSPDSGKKRKLRYEQLGLPMSKHKFRDRCSSPSQGSPTQTHLEDEQAPEKSTALCRTNRKVDAGHDPSGGSHSHSNSFVAGGGKSPAGMPPEELVLRSRPSTSSGIRGNTSSWQNLYSLDSRIPKKADHRDLTASLRGGYSDPEDEIQEEPEHGALGDHGERIEECPDAAIEELMLYSNDMPSGALVHHPSGRWGFQQDARVGTMKPTIDQEFEQYFSMLIL
uniref:Uncharacterized protein n=1 Tax=Anthurium amnicola TaxID=1678845 RepID=A0A1D1YKM7_9ARAE